jgi:hypothetical protein
MHTSFLSAAFSSSRRPTRGPVRGPADLYAEVCATARGGPVPAWAALAANARAVYADLYREASENQRLFSGLSAERRALFANRYAGITAERGTPIPAANLRVSLALTEEETELFERMERFRRRLARVTRAPDLAGAERGEAVAPKEHFARDALGSMAEARESGEPPEGKRG